MIDRLKKKCVLGSAIFHGLLCGAVLFGSAFGGKAKKDPPPQAITLINFDGGAILTDGVTHGGDKAPAAAPAAKPAPEPAPPPPAPDPTPVKPEPVEPVKPVVVPKPAPTPKPEPQQAEKPLFDPLLDQGLQSVSAPKKPTPKKPHKVEVDLTKTVDIAASRKAQKAAEEAEERETAAAEAKARRDKLNRLRGAIGEVASGTATAIGKSGAKGVVVNSVGGDGTGGPAFVNYTQYIISAYYNAWTLPNNLLSDTATVTAVIVVARDGTVTTYDITEKSSDPGLNESVKRALRTVKTLKPFPAESHDSERRFEIIFKPEAKEQIG